jgi:predicted transcriptional regulator
MSSTTRIANYMKELKTINNEIRRLTIQLKNLRDKKKDLEKHILSFLKQEEQPGLRYQEMVVLSGEKKIRDKKYKEHKEQEIINLLENAGVNDAKNTYNTILEAMKGEQHTVPTLKIKNSVNTNSILNI